MVAFWPEMEPPRLDVRVDGFGKRKPSSFAAALIFEVEGLASDCDSRANVRYWGLTVAGFEARGR